MTLLQDPDDIQAMTDHDIDQTDMVNSGQKKNLEKTCLATLSSNLKESGVLPEVSSQLGFVEKPLEVVLPRASAGGWDACRFDGFRSDSACKDDGIATMEPAAIQLLPAGV